MSVGGWAEIGLLLTSVAYGTISAVVPIANAEAYVAASQVAQATGPAWVALAIGTGQTIGKSILFYGVRRGRDSRWSGTAGPWRGPDRWGRPRLGCAAHWPGC